MIAVALLASWVVAAAEPEVTPSSPAESARESLFSDCAIAEIARLEKTTPDKLGRFSKKNANKAVASCQRIKSEWAIALDQKYASDSKFQDPVQRKAEVSRIVSVDELALFLLISLKAK